MIDVSTTLYKNQTALEHLNYLFDSSQINFEHHLLLAEFTIHEGQFTKAKKLLDEAKSIHPYYVPRTDDLMGRMYLLSKKHAQAISSYKKYLAEKNNDPHTLYSIAKLYAQSGNKNEAWKWLQQSMATGFRYSYVLKADATWDEMRKTSQWKSLIKKYPARTYFEPHLIQLQSSSN
jgi:tetratricopeptide (TPR) repeat protein